MAIDGGRIISYLELDTSQYVAAQRAAVAQAGIFNDVSATTTAKLQSLGTAMKTVGTTATIGLTMPIIGIGVAAFKSAESVESAFAGVKKTVDASESEFANLKQTLFDMSEQIPVTFQDLSGMAEIAGQLGVGVNDLQKFTRTIADLGVSTNLSGEEAATMLAQYANVTGMPLANIDRLGSVIVELGNNTATTERDIAQMAQRLSGTANILDLTDAQTMGLAATMSSLGIEAEAGGSSMARTLSGMQQAVLGGGKHLEAFGKIAGTTGKSFANTFKGDPIAALNLFVQGLGRIKASGGDVYAALEKVDVQDIRMTETLLKMTGAQDTLTDNIDMANAAWASNSALTEEAGKRYETTESQLQLAKNSISNMTASLGELLLPVVTDVAGAIGDAADAINSLDKETKGMILTVLGLIAAAGPLSLLIGGIVSLVTGPAGIVLGVVAAGAAIVGLVSSINTFNQTRVNNELAERFGDVELSAEKIKEIVDKEYKIIFDSEDLNTAIVSLDDTTKKIGELNGKIDDEIYELKVGVGTPEDLAAQITTLVSEGQTLIDQQHKVVKLRIDTFFGEDNPNGETLEKSFDEYFEDVAEAAQKKGAEIGEKTKELMADGQLDENDRKIIDNLRWEYMEIIRRATLEDTEVSKTLFTYNAKKEGLTAESVKALAEEAVRLKREEEAALLSEQEALKRYTIRTGQAINTDKESPGYGKPYKTQEQIFADLAMIDDQYKIDQVTVAAANADFAINTTADSFRKAYSGDVEKLFLAINQAQQEAFASAQQAAIEEASNAEYSLDTATGQQQFRDAFDRLYQSGLNERLYDVESSLPDPAAVTGIQQVLSGYAPIIESIQESIQGMENLGAALPDEWKPKLEEQKQYLDFLSGLNVLTEGASDILNTAYTDTGTDYANQALKAAQQAQEKAKQKASEAQAQAEAQAKAQAAAAQATPEGRAQAVMDELQTYSETLSTGISQITKQAWSLAQEQMWAQGVNTNTPDGKKQFEESYKQQLDAFANQIDSLVPPSVREKAQAALQGLMPDIKSAKDQAAKMGDNISPELQALLDMYTQIEQLATGGSDLVTQLQNDIGSAASSAGSDAATQMGTAITTGIDSQAPAFATSGENTGQGFVDGVLSKVGAAKDAGAALAAATDQGIREKAVIASPSKLAEQEGAFTSQGYINGVISGLDRALGAGEQLADATKQGLNNRPLTTADWKKLLKDPKFDANDIKTIDPKLSADETKALAEAQEQLAKEAAARADARRRAQEAAELAAVKAHGQQLLEIDRQTYQARLDMQERQHSVMMAMIGDYSAWYADTTLDTALEKSAAYYQAQQDSIKAQYDADMARAKKQAQKDALTASYNERIALINQQSATEQNALRENYEIQQRIALEWINSQKALMNQELAAKQEAARKEDYEQDLADLQKRQRQTKSARERRELQEQIDDMIRNEQLRLEEAEAQQIQAAWDQLSKGVSAGIIGLGDLTQNMNLPAVAFGSGGLGALTDITASELDSLISSLSASMHAGNSIGGFGIGSISIDLRGSVVRSQEDIDAITEGVVDKIEDKLRSLQR